MVLSSYKKARQESFDVYTITFCLVSDNYTFERFRARMVTLRATFVTAVVTVQSQRKNIRTSADLSPGMYFIMKTGPTKQYTKTMAEEIVTSMSLT